MQSKWNTPPTIIIIPTFSLWFCLGPKTMIPVVLYMARPATDLACMCVFEGNRQGLFQVWKLSLLFTSLCGLTHDVLLCWNRLRSCWVKNNPKSPQFLTVTFSVSYAFLWQAKQYSATSLTKHWFKLDALVLFLSPNPPFTTHTQIYRVTAFSTAQSPAAGWQVGQLTCATVALL